MQTFDQLINASTTRVSRRNFVLAAAAGLAGFAAVRRPEPMSAAGKPAAAGKAKTVRIAEFGADGVRKGVVEVPKIIKSDAEWKKQLTPIEFEVTRKAGTERAFTGTYWNLHQKGLYRCVCCGTA
ncbi:MAG TPA: peptide-methionine (R)-S-oxide reductase, partial [Terriglobia bacterium]|nr:peptide-methionine (R)-S-oxide reductase [Terriglobia bacterium]